MENNQEYFVLPEGSLIKLQVLDVPGLHQFHYNLKMTIKCLKTNKAKEEHSIRFNTRGTNYGGV